MNITPETARSFADDATLKVEIPTRIEKDQVFYSLVTDDDRTVATDLDKGDAELLAIAPDLAQTIAGMRWEYAVQMMEEEWEMVGIYGPDEPWGSEGDARYTMEAWRSSHPIRLVRRLVGPVEVVE